MRYELHSCSSDFLHIPHVFACDILFLWSLSTSPVSFALLLPFLSKLFFAVGHHLAREWHIVIVILSGRLSRCYEQPQHQSLHEVGSSHSTQGRKLHPANTQTLCAQVSLDSFEHHWRSMAYPDFVSEKTGLRQRGKWPCGARPWPRRRDHAWTAGLWTSYPCVPGVNSLVATRVSQR